MVPRQLLEMPPAPARCEAVEMPRMGQPIQRRLRPGAAGWGEDASLEKPIHSGFGGTCIYTALLKPRIVEIRTTVALS
jgi:hypothetical protein